MVPGRAGPSMQPRARSPRSCSTVPTQPGTPGTRVNACVADNALTGMPAGRTAAAAHAAAFAHPSESVLTLTDSVSLSLGRGR